MRAHKQAGFTLIEAILVITIGTVLLASGTVLYRQYRQSVGDSAALDKVMALQGTVESLYALRGGNYPDVQTLYSTWQAKRPQDFDMSPWGGFAVYNNSNIGVGGGIASDSGQVPDPISGDRGVLYYWQTDPNSPGAKIHAQDSAGGDPVDVTFYNYLVAVVPNDGGAIPPYWFVRGSRLASGSNSYDLEGQVGNGGGGDSNAPSDPW